MAYSLWSTAAFDSQNSCENKGCYLVCSCKIKVKEVVGKGPTTKDAWKWQMELLSVELGKGKEK